MSKKSKSPHSDVRGVYYRALPNQGWTVRKWDPDQQRICYLAFFPKTVYKTITAARKVAEAYSIKHGDGWRTATLVTRGAPGRKLPVGVKMTRQKPGGPYTGVLAYLQVEGEMYDRYFPIDPKRPRQAVNAAIKYRHRLEQQVFGRKARAQRSS